MIKQFGDYATTQAVSEGTALPKGGYVCKILNAQIKENSNGQYCPQDKDFRSGR